MQNIKAYFFGVGTEIKRIRWPKGKEMVKNSVAVLTILIFFSLFFYGLDWAFAFARTIGR